MIRNWKLLGICSFLFGLLLATPLPVRAAGEFRADYDVQYAVSPAGKTIVTQQVTLTNKLPNFYPQEYALVLDSDKISGVIAYDDGGVITPTVKVTDGKTNISLKFNVKAIGLGKALTFSLRYEHSGVATKSGSIWEVYVPGVAEDPDIETYDVTLSIPPTFGPASYLSPRPAKGTTWTKDQMTKGGIAGAYGTAQNFRVTLDYELSNPSVLTSIQDIALPPDTAYQKVVLSSLEPKPVTVVLDDDGNWIARYQVAPRQALQIKAVADIAIHLSPREEFQKQTIDASSYTNEQEFWETTDPKIVELAKQYKTPRAIYDYVSNTLSYDYEKVTLGATRMGAKEAIASPKSAVCTEFTDLFVAIARAAGIPTRRVLGYAYTNNAKLRPLSLVSDVLHAWPEYYDAEGGRWVPVDPTWAHTTGGVDYFTKLDYNHITFAINGKHSSEPYPAGFYHNPDKQSKDVSVEFSSQPDSRQAQVSASIEFPDQVGAGTKVAGAVVVSNMGGQPAYNIDVAAISEQGGIHVVDTLPTLLPYAVTRVPITGSYPQTLQSIHSSITATVNGATQTKQYVVRPLYWVIGLGVLLIAIIMLISIKMLKPHVWKRLKKQ